MERSTTISLSSHVVTISRRARRVIGATVAGAALFAAGLGCTGWSAESCDQYLLCVSATTPLAQSEQLALYGKDGTCWKQIEPEQCARSCKAGLRALAQTSTAKECHPTTTTPEDDDPIITMPPFSWPLPSKMAFYSGPKEELLLTGEDPVTGDWRCKRDDKNTSPPSEIARMAEPNELPDQAILLPNPLPVDPPSSSGATYEICPDRSAPTVSDFDTFKFKVNTSGKYIAELKYQAKYGDLDVSLFRDDGGPGMHNPVLVAANVTGTDNACIERDLPVGTYYLVVYGARDPVMQTKTAMNRYQLRVFQVEASGYTCQ